MEKTDKQQEPTAEELAGQFAQLAAELGNIRFAIKDLEDRSANLLAQMSDLQEQYKARKEAST